MIEGTVEGSAFGGSIAQEGGHTQITDSASLQLNTGGVVKDNVYGGSQASGENSQTSEVQTSVVIEGTVEVWALGGSIAVDGGHSEITESASLKLNTGSVVKKYVYGGSWAFGENSQTSVVQTSIVIEGTVEGWAYGGSIAQDGGHTQITDSASLQLNTGSVVKENVYGGSWAFGENSQTSDVQTSTVIEGTVEGEAFGGSCASRGGHSEITESASLQLNAGGLVKNNVFGGSRADGESRISHVNSQTIDVQTSAVIEGTVDGDAFGGSKAEKGGYWQITQGSSLIFKKDGQVINEVKQGSQTSDDINE